MRTSKKIRVEAETDVLRLSVAVIPNEGEKEEREAEASVRDVRGERLCAHLRRSTHLDWP